MFDTEEECWKKIENDLRMSKICAVAGIAGVLIEKSYARQQGRGSVPNYQAEEYRRRLEKRMGAAGFSEKEIADTRNFAGGNIMSVIAGLANAGMH